MTHQPPPSPPAREWLARLMIPRQEIRHWLGGPVRSLDLCWNCPKVICFCLVLGSQAGIRWSTACICALRALSWTFKELSQVCQHSFSKKRNPIRCTEGSCTFAGVDEHMQLFSKGEKRCQLSSTQLQKVSECIFCRHLFTITGRCPIIEWTGFFLFLWGYIRRHVESWVT